jgi:hypothetical protein
MIKVIGLSRVQIYGKSKNAIFRHLEKEFTNLIMNPGLFSGSTF